MMVDGREIKVSGGQHENKQHGTPMFPCGGYITRVGDHLAEAIPWHWHEEIEVLAVHSGSIRLDTPTRSILLHEGEAAFINSSVLQSGISTGKGFCVLHSFVFDPQLIFGALESDIEQRYVRPLLQCPGLDLIHFQQEKPWHREATQCIEEGFVAYQAGEFGYELAVREQLSRLWFLIVTHHQWELAQHRTSRNTETLRVKEMLGYIHAHYMEPLRLRDIADAAAISDRECLRCFNKVLGVTPMKYLLAHRISVAVGLLSDPEGNITEIGRLSGFESPSYFALKFKDFTGMTPSEYRRGNTEEE